MRSLRAGIVERALIVVGCCALGVYALCELSGAAYQTFERIRLEWVQRHGGATDAVGRIVIPRLGLSVVMRDGADATTLLLAAGHLPGTALPGEPGNVVVAGHRDSFFRHLREIRRGDSVEIVTPSKRIRYRVDKTLIVAPGRTDLLNPTPAPTLTLITCYPFHFIGRAPKRFIVRARQVDPPLHASGFRPLGTTIAAAR